MRNRTGLFDWSYGRRDRHDDETAIALRFRGEYVRALKKQKGVVLGRMRESLGIGRSVASRLLAQAEWHDDGTAKGTCASAPVFRPVVGAAVRRVGEMTDMMCDKCLRAMLPRWPPMLRAYTSS